MTDPILTIGIPTYRRLAAVKARIAELRAAIIPGVEVVISDNGSGDETLQFCERAAEEVSWLTVEHNEKNVGCDANYLKVLQSARGYYCWLLGDDDPIEWEHLPALVEWLRRKRTDIVRLPSRGIPVPQGAQRRFSNLAEFVHRFHSLSDFQILAGTIIRTNAAKPHLKYANQFRGLLHVYTAVEIAILRAGGTLQLYETRLLAERNDRPPRWNLLDGHLGAWETLRRTVPAELMAAVDRREASGRAKAIVRAAVDDLLGVSRGRVDTAMMVRISRLLPLRQTPLLVYLALARACWVYPKLTGKAFDVAMRARHDDCGIARVRERWQIPQHQTIAEFLEKAITERRKQLKPAVQPEY